MAQGKPRGKTGIWSRGSFWGTALLFVPVASCWMALALGPANAVLRSREANDNN